jgi:hypothetical protein
MAGQPTFRALVILGLALCLPIGVDLRVRAASGERLSWRDEGVFVMVALRLVGLVAWTALLVYMINPRWMAWSTPALPLVPGAMPCDSSSRSRG